MRPRTWPERRLRDLQLQFVRSKIALFAAVIGIFAAVGTVEWFAVRHAPTTRAFVLGGLVVGAAWTMQAVTAMFSGSMHVRMGKWGEDATRDQLKKLRGEGWTFVQGIKVMYGDIDFVAVGPAGVFLIEAKWLDAPSRDTANTRDRLVEYEERAAASARSLRLMLGSLGVTVDVNPVVVLWGGGAKQVFPHAVGSTCPVIHGRDLVGHLKALPERLAAANREDVRDRLIERRAQQSSS